MQSTIAKKSKFIKEQEASVLFIEHFRTQDSFEKNAIIG